MLFRRIWFITVRKVPKTVQDSIEDVDLVLFVLDAHAGISDTDRKILTKYADLKIPTVLALTKTDIMPENLLISELGSLADLNLDIVPVSARKNRNVKELIKVIVDKLPEGEKLFDFDIISDRSEKFMISEIVREKVLLKCDKEVPHGVAVIVNVFDNKPNKKTCEISVDIICERPNHKAIIIGKGGAMIKQISTLAREEMERFLDKKVFLTTYVKVKEDWRNSAFLLKEHGYSE